MITQKTLSILYNDFVSNYTGEQTALAKQNFPFPLPFISLSLIYAIALIKKAAAMTNTSLGKITVAQKDAIVQACDEIRSHQHDESFTLPYLQGGAGTSINMNVNEVIALRANEILEEQKSSERVHALDHVNLFQSTNDVNPSALRIALLGLLPDLFKNLDDLISAFAKKSEETRHILKIGRTHMQDAVPIRFSDEFSSYKATIARHKANGEYLMNTLYALNLGGTAVGNSINIPDGYIREIYTILSRETTLPLKPAENFMSLTSSSADFMYISSFVHLLCVDLSKIASDIRFLSSGPGGGIGEISLSHLQKGSSIMPGKVNPVIPESVNQLSFVISGKHQTVCMASENGHLELAVMFPVIAEAVLTSVTLTCSVVGVFAKNCIETLVVNGEKAKETLEQTTAYATLFTPILGYDTVTKAINESVEKKTTFKNVLIDQKLLTPAEFESIIDAYLAKQQ